MALITLLNAQLAFGHVALLDHADFSLETNERVGLIGRNGAGKSSMLKILGGMEKPDDGNLYVQSGIRVAYVAQEPVLDPDATIFEAVSAGLAGVKDMIEQKTPAKKTAAKKATTKKPAAKKATAKKATTTKKK